MPGKADPKISTSEAVLIGLFLLMLDGIDLIPVAGDLTDIAGAPLILYYYTKHINGVAYVVSEILDAIPIVQEFPSRSVVWWATVAFDRLAPAKVAQVVEELGEAGEGEEGATLEEGGELGAENIEEGQPSIPASERAGEGEITGAQPEEGLEEEEESERERGTTEEENRQGNADESPESTEARGEDEEDETEEDSMAVASEMDPSKVTERELFSSDADNGNGAIKEEQESDENVVSIDKTEKWRQNKQNGSAHPTKMADVVPFKRRPAQKGKAEDKEDERKAA